MHCALGLVKSHNLSSYILVCNVSNLLTLECILCIALPIQDEICCQLVCHHHVIHPSYIKSHHLSSILNHFSQSIITKILLQSTVVTRVTSLVTTTNPDSNSNSYVFHFHSCHQSCLSEVVSLFVSSPPL